MVPLSQNDEAVMGASHDTKYGSIPSKSGFQLQWLYDKSQTGLKAIVEDP